MHNNHTYISFDFGTKKIGIAVGQTITLSARPLMTLKASNQRLLWDHILQLVAQWQPTAFIVGLSLQPDGSHSDTSKRSLAFGESLENKTGLKVHYTNERLTTVAAREYVRDNYPGKNKPDIDAVAAALILESWFNNLPEAIK